LNPSHTIAKPQKKSDAGFIYQWEAIASVLKQAGKPLHISDIAERLSQQYPGRWKTQHLMHAVSRQLVLQKDRFKRVSSGTYALSDLEQEEKLRQQHKQLLSRKWIEIH